MNYFQHLLCNSPIVFDKTIKKVIEHELEIKTGPFNKFELDLVLKKLKNKKGSPEVWKTGKFNDLLFIFVMKCTMEM